MFGLQDNIERNNRAVVRLQAGHAREALEMLRRALEELKDQFLDGSGSSSLPVRPPGAILSPEDSSDFTLSDTQISFDDEGSLQDDASEHSVPAVQPVPIQRGIPLQQGSLESDFFITSYDKALIISEDEQNRETISAVVLYNMALINHNRGIQSGRTSLLKKALRLYRMSLEILLKADFHSQLDVNLLLLALFNNTAQIYSQRYDLDQMRHCLGCMREVLATEPEEAANEEHLSTFFMNTMFYPGEEITSAPAA